MPLLRAKNLCIAFGDHALLENADLEISRGERIGILGRNGEGKSTLLKIIGGEIHVDSGELWVRPGVVVSLLQQSPAFANQISVYDAVMQGLGETGHHLLEYNKLNQAANHSQQRLGELHHLLEQTDGWNLQQNVDRVISQLGLDPDQSVDKLSGGWKRRVSLARTLAAKPDILLLDEPTNHLDIDSILWLERLLLGFNGAILFITHDRSFLRKLSSRIIDLDRGSLTSWSENYDNYLRRKQAVLQEQERHNQLFDKKLAQEEAWIRQGIKARRTRNEGRVRALQKLRLKRAERRNQKGKVNLAIEDNKSSGKLVIEAKNCNISFDGKPLIEDFSLRIMRGDRVGLIGPNGIGKTTLIKMLLAQLQPDSGSIKHGTSLEVAYYDQLRSELDLNATVVDVIGQGREFITINDKPRHVISWLSDFLFTPQRARSQIRSLSGGERARVMLAWLFSRPVNLLVMDEPTNDLDIETLELLEELLLEFKGTLLLISHDREFMDNVVTSTLAFGRQGKITEYVGGYSDWLRQKPEQGKSPKTDKQNTASQAPTQPKKKKLSYNQQRELDQLPKEIEDLDQQQQKLTGQISSPSFYEQDKSIIDKTLAELSEISTKLEARYTRWEELEG